MQIFGIDIGCVGMQGAGTRLVTAEAAGDWLPFSSLTKWYQRVPAVTVSTFGMMSKSIEVKKAVCR